MTAFVSWWQHLPERIDPVFFQTGFIQIRYYGLMYLTSFLVAYGLTRRRAEHEQSAVTKQHIDDYISWVIIGVLLGARLGYVIFYNAGYFLSHPLEIFWPFRSIDGELYFGISGMSYHGGLLGAVAASIMFCRRYRVSVWTFADFVIPAVPLGYMFGRIGNFLNGELYGRITTQWWGMYFPHAQPPALRHPSQLYEAFFEGLFLFVVLWMLRRKPVAPGTLFFLYILGYGVVRFFIEFFREPDSHIGFIAGALSVGQVLCLSMIMIGLVGIISLRKTGSHGAKNI